MRSEKEEEPTLFRKWFPQMDWDECQELFERIESGAEGGRDYAVMMLLSATLASLGLLQDSTAVVIGAMLVAPLMGPLVGAGLALVQGNLELMRKSMMVALVGIALGLAISVFFGAINPGYEPTMEVEDRGAPDIFDLFIALTAGMIAAYAQCRTRLSNTLAGVAIAAALLPPLAVVGIAATLSEYEIAIFAGILLLTNIVAIIIGAAIIFRLVGVQTQRRDSDARPWVGRVLAVLLMTSLVLAGPLVLRGIEGFRTGQTRPSTYPVSVPVRKALREYMADHPEILVINVSRLSVAPESGITILLSAFEPIPRGFRRGLRNAVRSALGQPLLDDLLEEPMERVRIYIMMEAPYVAESAPTSDVAPDVHPDFDPEVPDDAQPGTGAEAEPDGSESG